MADAIESFSPKEWERFCEAMLRQHYGQKQFYTVPDEDGGDLGLEFFSIDGTLFQCYYPEPGVEMKLYKKRVQKKINDDLKKLKENEYAIGKLLDNIKINQWILLIPENKSKDLITYCNKKKTETLLQNIAYIDQSNFRVKIETADSYPAAKLYALGTYNATINIPIFDVTSDYKEKWKDNNSAFMTNISRKSDNLMNTKASGFKERVVEKYIQTEKLLEQLRVDHPDLLEHIEDTAMAQLENMRNDSIFQDICDGQFVKTIVSSNSETFSKYSKHLSDKNVQALSFGYLSLWIARCYMDFE